MLLRASLALIAVAAAASAAAAAAADPLWQRVSDAGIKEFNTLLKDAAMRGGGNAASGSPGYKNRVDDMMALFATPLFAERFTAETQEFNALRHDVRRAAVRGMRHGADFAVARQSAPCAVANGSVARLPAADGAALTAAAWHAVRDADVVVLPLAAAGRALRDALATAAAAAPRVRAVIVELGDGDVAADAPLPRPHAAAPDALAAHCVLTARRGALQRALADAAGGALALKVDAGLVAAASWNVFLKSKAGDAKKTIIVGAHLDSVRAGPGANDDASGSATTLELARRYAEADELLGAVKNRLVFAWWGSEELGLIGSRFFVRQSMQSDAVVPWDDVALNINNDMVASTNWFRGLYRVTSSSIPARVRAACDKIMAPMRAFVESQLTPPVFDDAVMSGNSGTDIAPFLANGKPGGGTFTGTSTRKSSAQQQRYGGTAGSPYDACYHRSCDTSPENLDANIHLQNTQTNAVGLQFLAEHDDLLAYLYGDDAAAVSRAPPQQLDSADAYTLPYDDDNRLFMSEPTEAL